MKQSKIFSIYVILIFGLILILSQTFASDNTFHVPDSFFPICLQVMIGNDVIDIPLNKIESDDGELKYEVDNHHITTENYEIKINSVVSLNAILQYGITVSNFKSNSQPFSYFFQTPINIGSVPTLVSSSLCYGLTDYTGDGVFILPNGQNGHIQEAYVKSPQTNLGVDLDDKGSVYPSASNPVSYLNCFHKGPLLGPYGPWTSINIITAFILSGNFDSVTINGSVTCNSLYAMDIECSGDFDFDYDVDGSDLGVFAQDFGRTDCQLRMRCVADQEQEIGINSNLFEKGVVRWQEFYPEGNKICNIMIKINRIGEPPGNILIALEGASNNQIWKTIVYRSTIPSGINWISVFVPDLKVIPGASYKLKVWSNEPSSDPRNRYFWLSSSSDVYPGVSSISRRDFTFRIFKSIKCEGDFDNDGDVDGSDLALFAIDFGRRDCTISE